MQPEALWEAARLMSLVEAVTNVVVGSALALWVQVLVFLPFGLQTTLRQNLKLVLVFRGVSIVRGYVLRRLFDGLR